MVLGPDIEISGEILLSSFVDSVSVVEPMINFYIIIDSSIWILLSILTLVLEKERKPPSFVFYSVDVSYVTTLILYNGIISLGHGGV